MAKKQPAKPKPVSKAKAKSVPSAPDPDQPKAVEGELLDAEDTEELGAKQGEGSRPTPPTRFQGQFQGGAKQTEGESPDGTQASPVAENDRTTQATADDRQNRFQGNPPQAEQTEGKQPEGTQGLSQTPTAGDSDRQNETGKIADSVEFAGVPGPELLPESSRARLTGEKKHEYWERMRKAARLAGLARGQGPGTAYVWATQQAEREFPPPVTVEVDLPAEESNVPNVGTIEPPSIPVVSAPVSDDQGVSGLSDLPPSWPELPANAQLQIEIAWVTANRLRVRDGTGVNLSKALSPAPSYSALSWLETSILFPAKFADISVRATASQDDEREFIKREKMAIEEIRSILSEMLEAEG